MDQFSYFFSTDLHEILMLWGQCICSCGKRLVSLRC